MTKDVEGSPVAAMAPADRCCNSPPSPSPPSSSSSTPQWIVSPSRIRDSAPRPRRSLLSSHFSASLHKDPKVQQLACPSSLSENTLSKSLPSPPIAAFLDREEEEALEPSTPPHVGFSLVAPSAPRKSFMYRAPPLGKHKPRRLLFEDKEEEEEEEGVPPAPSEISKGGFSQPTISIRGDVTPPRQSYNSFAASNPCKRLHMRDLR